MVKRPTFFTDTEALKLALGKDLPFDLAIDVHKKGGAHTVIRGWWELNHGQRPYGHTPFVFELAFVMPAHQRDYKSGIVEMHTDHDFQGLGIASTLVRNALPLFRLMGNRTITLNTQNEGAAFWQKLGFKASEHEADLNGDEWSEDDWTPDRVFMAHDEQCEKLRARVDVLESCGIISQQTAAEIRACIKPDEPDAIWALTDRADTLKPNIAMLAKVLFEECERNRTAIHAEGAATVRGHIAAGTVDELIRDLTSYSYDYSRSRDEKIARVLLKDMRVHCELDLNSNAQKARFAEVTGNFTIDDAQFNVVRDRYVTEIRRQYEEQRRYDEIMSAAYAPTPRRRRKGLAPG